MRTDGWTERHDEASSRFSQFLRTHLKIMSLLLLLLLLLTAIELSLGSSSPYTSTDKPIRINIHKRNRTKNTVQTIQNTVNASTHITKTPTHYKIHTITSPHVIKKVKTTRVQDTPKLNRHSIIEYPRYKVTLMYMVLLSPRTSP